MSQPLNADNRRNATLILFTFPRASMKREMMCRRLEILQRTVERGDVDDIQMALGDFLMEARSLHDVLRNEGKSVEGFSAWWGKLKEDLKADPLMKWAHDARVGDFHHGIPSIEVTGWEAKGAIDYDPSQMSAGKSQVLRDEGMFWVSGAGTPTERIERARIKVTEHSMHLRITGLSIAQGAPQTVHDLPTLCERIVRRNQDLLHEAKVIATLQSNRAPDSSPKEG